MKNFRLNGWCPIKEMSPMNHYVIQFPIPNHQLNSKAKRKSNQSDPATEMNDSLAQDFALKSLAPGVSWETNKLCCTNICSSTK